MYLCVPCYCDVCYVNCVGYGSADVTQYDYQLLQKKSVCLSTSQTKEQYIRENILIYGVEEDKEDINDGKKVLFSVADERDIDLQPNDMQRVHQLGQIRRIHAQSLQGLCHARKEASVLLTYGISKLSKADSISFFVRISRL